MSAHLEKKARAEASFVGFLRRQLLTQSVTLPANKTLKGQIAIVTGSNTGLGFEASSQLLQLDINRLIMAVRSQERGDTAAAILRSKFPLAQVDVWLLDMASYDSILAFVQRCKSELPRLDVALLNAGLGSTSFKLNQTTGHEETMQVNYLSTCLLSILLVPLLAAKSREQPLSAPSRLTVVGSDTAFWATLDPKGRMFESFDNKAEYKPFDCYARGKLLLIMFVRKLAEYVSDEAVVVNVANPGLCKNTSLGATGSSRPGVKDIAERGFKALLGRTPETGAGILVNAAVVQGRESHGSYVSDWAVKPYPKLMYTAAGRVLKEKLWERTMEELNVPEVFKIITEMESAAAASK